MTDATRTVKEAGFYGQMAPWGKCVDWLGSADGQYSGWVKGFTMAHSGRSSVVEYARATFRLSGGPFHRQHQRQRSCVVGHGDGGRRVWRVG